MLLFLTPKLPPVRNGIGDYTAHLARALRVAGEETAVLTSRGQAPIPGIDVQPLVERWDDPGFPALLGHVRRLRPEVLLWQYNPFAFGQRGTSLAYPFLPFLLKRAGIRTVVTVHETYYPWLSAGKKGLVLNPAQRLWLGLVATTAGACVATYGETTAFLRHWRTEDAATLAQIPVGANVVPVPLPGGRREHLRRGLGATASTLVVGTFGTLGSGQSPDVALRALAALPATVDWCYVVVGDASPTCGPGSRLMALARALGVSDHVSWTGHLPANGVSEYLQCLDVCAALYDDGVSGRRGTIAAVFAHALPVITNAGVATSEAYLRHDDTCWLVELSPHAVGRGLERLADPALRVRLGTRAGQAFQQELAWPVIAGRYRSLLDVVRRPGPGARPSSA